MADPELPGVRAEMQREDGESQAANTPSFNEQSVRWLLLLIFAIAVLAVIAFAYFG